MSELRPIATMSQEDVQAGLRVAGVRGALEGLRLVDAAYDRGLEVARLTRNIAEGDDFRVAHGAGEHERWVFLERLPWDSEFFGRGIARLGGIFDPTGPVGLRDSTEAAERALRATLDHARERGISYVIANVASDDLPSLRATQAAGFSLVETRAIYHRPLTGPPTERYPARRATEADIPSLAEAAATTINPFDRFHADVTIPTDVAGHLMREWVRASVADGFADLTVVPDERDPEAFCTARLHREHWEGWGVRLAQPVLSAVAPRHRGWYVKIISELDEQLRLEGAEHSYLITQVTNNAVIRSWEKLGYRFGKVEYVLRAILE